jgi:hypothetical protein
VNGNSLKDGFHLSELLGNVSGWLLLVGSLEEIDVSSDGSKGSDTEKLNSGLLPSDLVGGSLLLEVSSSELGVLLVSLGEDSLE